MLARQLALSALAFYSASASPVPRSPVEPSTCAPTLLPNASANLILDGSPEGTGWIPTYTDVDGESYIANVTYGQLQPSLPEPYWVLTQGEYGEEGVYRIRRSNELDLCLTGRYGTIASQADCAAPLAGWNITCTSCEPGIGTHCQLRAALVDQCATYNGTDSALVLEDCLPFDGGNSTQTWSFDQTIGEPEGKVAE
ncbi:hypothetical protein JCM10450v2_008022 [Rhodotorula kratochvilovae]